MRKSLAVPMLLLASFGFGRETSAETSVDSSIGFSTERVGALDGASISKNPAFEFATQVGFESGFYVGGVAVYSPLDMGDDVGDEIDPIVGYNGEGKYVNYMVAYSFINSGDLGTTNDDVHELGATVLIPDIGDWYGIVPAAGVFLHADPDVSEFVTFYQAGALKDFMVADGYPVSVTVLAGGHSDSGEYDAEALSYVRTSVGAPIPFNLEREYVAELNYQNGLGDSGIAADHNCWLNISTVF